MKQLIVHPWEVSATQAVKIQRELFKRFETKRFSADGIRLVAGIDAAYDKGRGLTIAGAVVYNVADGSVKEEKYAVIPTRFPYVPGLLAFREGEAICRVLESLESIPECLMFDGHGYAHPRRMGIATHIGILFGMPSLGCAKRKLIGNFDQSKDEDFLVHNGEIVGVALRTKPHTRHIFISVGNMMRLEDAKEIVLACLRGYKLPEPTRLADAYVARVKREI